MNKFLMCIKILILLTVLICFSLSGTILTAVNAVAAEDSDQLLKNTDELLRKASAAAMQAKETSDLILTKSALEQADTAAGLLLGLADTAQKEGDVELALAALAMANQTSNVISDILTVSLEAWNVELVSSALDVAEQTSLLVSNVATMAQETGNPPLAQAAFYAANRSRAKIARCPRPLCWLPKPVPIRPWSKLPKRLSPKQKR